MRSWVIDVDGPIQVAEWGEGRLTFVLVHGLAGSHLNWMAVAPDAQAVLSDMGDPSVPK